MHIQQALILFATSTILGWATSSPISCALPPEPHVSFIPQTLYPEAPVQRLFSISNFGFENLAIRANGQILTTAAFGPAAQLWQVDPRSVRQPVLLHKFSSATATLGITELAEDIFYVATLNDSQPGSGAVFSIDMRRCATSPQGILSTPPIINKVASLNSSIALNGMSHIHKSDDFVLIADTILGGVWKTNIKTGRSILIIKDPTMNGPPNTTSIAAFGINGIRIQNNTLFYCNSGRQSLYRMPIHDNASSAGPAQLVAAEVSCDDFAIDAWGFLYVASPSNALLRVDSRTGAQRVVAGTFNSSSSNIIGASSVQFGRRADDRTSVYVTTNGGSFTCAPPGSQGISRVDLGDLAQPCA